MYNDYERVKLLFEYTKFHMSVYITLASVLVGVIGLKKNLVFTIQPFVLAAGIFFIMVAGMAGGTIVSRLTQVKSYEEFWEQKTGPGRSKWFKGEVWTYIEHFSFWVGLLLAVAAILLPALKS